ncbi:hypothetical protein BBM86_05200 [Vibrio parahaemolyticus]|uniref:DUF2971 domain-containing protein n=1 Tax=Vibrio parahaemolyticus TaxID=670 RepID=UPI00084A88FA|nr:DUF2971 domain-containing protein [Vibrio parahaemolyticus]ELG4788131.1 DUF2971 domain-containing protein [Vibrio vulnificus]OEB86451.1 hypothetical protein BBM86_05200 [Vibrio parahaemolyticus]
MKKTFYKYLPPERDTYFSDSLLRFTPPSDLNDPYEGLPGISEELLDKVLSIAKLPFLQPPEGLKALERDPSLFIEPFLRKGMAKIDSALGILSLSEFWNNPLMWSHYAASHQGFCVGFDSEHQYFDFNEHQSTCHDMTVLPVNYSNQRFMLTTKRMDKKDVFNSLCTKSTDWTYEGEIRMISSLMKADKTITKEPYNIALFKVPHDSITELTIGLRSSSELEKKARLLARDLSVPLYRTAVSRNSFDLDRILLNG